LCRVRACRRLCCSGKAGQWQAVGTSTDIINMTGIHFDCDLTVAGTMRFQGP